LVPFEKRETLIIIHGYGGAGVLFYSVMKQLVRCFNIVFIDIIGLAGSSRPDDFSEDFSPQQIIDYFVDYMERWRISMSVVIGKLKLKR